MKTDTPQPPQQYNGVRIKGEYTPPSTKQISDLMALVQRIVERSRDEAKAQA